VGPAGDEHVFRRGVNPARPAQMPGDGFPQGTVAFRRVGIRPLQPVLVADLGIQQPVPLLHRKMRQRHPAGRKIDDSWRTGGAAGNFRSASRTTPAAAVVRRAGRIPGRIRQRPDPFPPSRQRRLAPHVPLRGVQMPARAGRHRSAPRPRPHVALGLEHVVHRVHGAPRQSVLPGQRPGGRQPAARRNAAAHDAVPDRVEQRFGFSPVSLQVRFVRQLQFHRRIPLFLTTGTVK